MAMALHSRWMNVTVDSIHATGGAAANRDILQVMADVFGAVGLSAAGRQLGRARRRAAGASTARATRRAAQPMSWDDVVKGFVEPIAHSALRPTRARHAIYQELIEVYAACEAHALGRGPIPSPRLAEFARRRE